MIYGIWTVPFFSDHHLKLGLQTNHTKLYAPLTQFVFVIIFKKKLLHNT